MFLLALCAGIAAGGQAGFAADAPPQPELTVAYSRATGPSAGVRLAARGWFARLAPEPDAFGNVAVVNLAVVGAVPGENLLEPPHGWTGQQPFMFVADDFAGHAPQDAAGRRRVFRLAGGAQLVATVVDAQVRPARRVPGGARFQFDSLSLSLELIRS
jgi:hypothetical protein